MNTELTMLVYSVILTFLIISVPALGGILQNGLATQAGARDGLPEPSVFAKRARRLQDNMIENMVLFIPLVLAAQAAGVSTAQPALGAEIFVIARVLHAVIYLAGIPWLRPVAWAGGVVGMGMILLALL